MPHNLSYSIIESLEVGGGNIGGGFFRHGGTSGSSESSGSSGSNNLKASSKDKSLYEDQGENKSQSGAEISASRRRAKDKVSLVEENKKKIKIAYPIYGEPMSHLTMTGAKDGLTFRAWEEVNKSMIKNGVEYDIEYVVVKEPKVDELVEGIKTRKYDMVIGDYGTNPNFLNDVSYTSPFMSIKDVGVYPEDSDAQYEYRLVKKIASVLLWPFLGLILLSLISSIYAYLFSRKFHFAGAFVQMMNGILGDRGSLISGNSFKVRPGKTVAAWALSILLLISSFAFLFYLQSIAISKSLDIISKNKDPFMFPEGKKVLVPRGATALQTLKDCCNIVTVEAKSKTTDVATIAKEFTERAKKEDLVGFYHSGPEVSKFIENNRNFIMSDTKFSNPSPVSFMVSKYRPELLYEVNKGIAEVNWSGVLNDTCKDYINRLCFSTQY
jgi:ABC-type amino acid transport substrate-binding protein